MSYRYPRSVRLRRREEFDLLFREGKRARGAYVRMLYIKAPEGAGTRIGVAVGKKQGKSCVRNRGRRLLKEAARRLLPWLKEDYWIVLQLSSAGLTKGARDIYFDMADLWRREGLMRADWPGADFTPWTKGEENE
ncbi:MAG: ribonuclease P protein component [Acetomicrobium sp.]|jgi:ribonuclease P protein component|uniref:Ribonuclease P protein component n=1 Tax=Acetomicrobium thermoterrenum DSM 13490 TaxID=1120987 RepID=A0A1H3DMN3_9BACT|nr:MULTISPECIES: ribonuclease P protein component [Acetomicrobium]MBC7321710.1 ribonuclease P protein component [Acetomicrobium sp.]SDX66919.1 ribonuclease P protein component [Acetomicrobium thermoterrenum DSM 13490]